MALFTCQQKCVSIASAALVLSFATIASAQNAPGAPVMTTERTSLHESRTSARARAICSSYAFRALGLSRVIQRVSPRS